MKPWIDQRRAAVLLHITSLPGPFHKGVLGQEAFDFIDSLRSGGFTVWQFLPLGPTHGHGSPYESLSTFAGNPELIDLRQCVTLGWLDAADLTEKMDASAHAKLRQKAGEKFWASIAKQPALKKEIAAFQKQQAYWLDDYSLFSAMKTVTKNHAWWQWGDKLRDRDPQALAQAKKNMQH